jgi:AraC-like DNA-binding protein
VIRHLEVAPGPALAPFVECLWMNVTDGPRSAILPDGCMDLVWFERLGVLVAGPQSHATACPDGATAVAFGVRFHPGAAPTLLRVPAHELLDGHVALDGIDPELARALDDRLQDAAAEPAAGFAAIEAELARRLTRAPAPDAVVRAAVARLDAPAASVADAAAHVSLSERQLHRRFAEHVGYGPKTLQRVLRLRRALPALPGGLAGAAAAAGYADQAHLSRDARRLTGLTPAQLVRRSG